MESKSKIESYRDLIVWQKAKAFAVSIYTITKKFPTSEMYGLTNQMRRAAVSIPSNIAEGFRRKSSKEKLQFMRIAYGSGAELETQIEIAYSLGFVSNKDHETHLAELDGIMRMLNKIIHLFEK